MQKLLKISIILCAVLATVALLGTAFYFYVQTPIAASSPFDTIATPFVRLIRIDKEAAFEASAPAVTADGTDSETNNAANIDASAVRETNIEHIYKVPQGKSAYSIANDLELLGIIRSARIFYVKARIEKRKIKAGRYRLSTSQSMDEILSLLETGTQEHITVSIPEGLTVTKVAALLEKAEAITSAKAFIDAAHNADLLAEFNIPAPSAEGYLFPDTYFFVPYMNEEDAVRRLIETFFQKAHELNIPVNDAQKLHDTVILASIVEREYRQKEEAPLIASVFANRLKKHIGLESCATIVYIITEIEGRPHPSIITYEDLKLNSTYNTYKWAGLPEGPIANPGTVALSAAANPPKTNYYYFRVEDEAAGKHHFSTSLEEHAAVGRSLAVKKAASE